MSAADPATAAPATGRGPRSPRGTRVAWVVAVALLVAIAWFSQSSDTGTPLDPRSTGQTGTAALVAVLEGVGADVTISGAVDDDADVLVLLQDRLTDQQRTAAVAHVRAGGRLVLLDPSSPVNPAAVTQVLFTEMLGALGEEPRCELLDGYVTRVESARWTVLQPTGRGTARCFPVADGFGLVVEPFGDGEVVVTGAVDALVNRAIDEADHARFGVALVAPEGDESVTFLWDPASLGGDTALLDLVPTGPRVAFWVLVAAAVLYAMARARRFGRPVEEHLPVRVPGSELVLAIGDLLSRGGHADAAAERLRASLRQEASRVLQLPPGSDDVLVDLAGERLRGRVDDVTLVDALGTGRVPDDDALTRVARSVARVRAALRSGEEPSVGSAGRRST